jgi:hypothetical protein
MGAFAGVEEMTGYRWLMTTTAIGGSLLTWGTAALAADMVPPMIPPPAPVAELPAVSGLNAKIEAFGFAFHGDEGDGAIGSDAGGGVAASVAFPLAERWGGQIDGIYGATDSTSVYGAGGHLFWRDPSTGLLGLYGSYAHVDIDMPGGGIADDGDLGKVGLEGELYLGTLSLLGLAAYQFGDVAEGFAGKLGASWYATEDLRFDLTGRYDEHRGPVGEVGATWHVTGTQVALFALGGVGQDEFYYGSGGIRFYLAQDGKSLIHRDREDDPQLDLPYDLYSAIGEGYCPPDTYLDYTGFCDGNI